MTFYASPLMIASLMSRKMTNLFETISYQLFQLTNNILRNIVPQVSFHLFRHLTDNKVLPVIPYLYTTSHVMVHNCVQIVGRVSFSYR